MQPNYDAQTSFRSQRRQPAVRRPRSAMPVLAPLAAALLASMPALSGAAKLDMYVPAPYGWAEGRILVMPRGGLPTKALEKILGGYGGKILKKVGQSDLYIVSLPADGTEKDIAKLLDKHPALKFAEVDQRIALHFAANDPYLGTQWHLSRIGASTAWDGAKGAGTTIAILDTGVNGAHPDLAGRMVAGWNFHDNNSDTADIHGHGTATAGTAAAAMDNAVGVASVAGQAMVMPVRISDPTGYAYWSTVAQGLTYAADRGVRVANISFGVAGSASVQSSADYMRGKGGLVIVSAGNNGIDENLPQTASMIPVSATDSSDMQPSWSSYGAFVAMSAPGANVYTTNRDGSYGFWNGTSFSSPIVAGVVGLMMSANPKLSGAQVESLLYGTATDLGTAGRDPVYGHGLVDAAGAVQAAKSAVPASDTALPSVSIAAPLGGATVSGIVPVDVTATDNVGVERVELRVNGTTVAIDTIAPFGFSWDSAGRPNGSASLVAVAFDEAGNSKSSATVTVNVANVTAPVAGDTTPPVVTIANPVAGKVSGTVTITANASDNAGAAGVKQTIYVDNVAKASGTGATLSYSWNTSKEKAGTHAVKVIASDAANNQATASVSVTR